MLMAPAAPTAAFAQNDWLFILRGKNLRHDWSFIAYLPRLRRGAPLRGARFRCKRPQRRIATHGRCSSGITSLRTLSVAEHPIVYDAIRCTASYMLRKNAERRNFESRCLGFLRYSHCRSRCV